MATLVLLGGKASTRLLQCDGNGGTDRAEVWGTINVTSRNVESVQVRREVIRAR
jgi:hypothetical protein